jgi:cyclopropane fatty-acyl-phospholipid synthase-like methyltransferase
MAAAKMFKGLALLQVEGKVGNISRVKEQGMDTKFIRKWNYYFQCREAAFKVRKISTLQLVYTKPNNPNL